MERSEVYEVYYMWRGVQTDVSRELRMSRVHVQWATWMCGVAVSISI